MKIFYNHNNTSGSIAIISIVFVVILLGLGAGWYFVSQPSEPPAMDSRMIIDRLSEITSAEYKSMIEARMSAVDSPRNPLTLIIGGQENLQAMQGNSATSSSSVYRFRVETSGGYQAADGFGGYWSNKLPAEGLNYTDTKVQAAKGATNSMVDFVSFETRAIDDVYYLKVTEFPEVPFISAFIYPFLGQWISIKQSDLNSEATSTSFVTESDVADQGSELTQSLKQNRSELITNFHQANIFSVISGDEDEVDGRPVIRYELAVDKQALISFLTDSARVIAADLSQDEEIDYEEGVTSMQQQLQDITFDKMTVGVIKESQFLQSITAEVTIDQPKKKEGSMVEPVITSPVNLHISLVLKNHNQPISIQAPADAKSFEEILNNQQTGQMMMSSSFGSSSARMNATFELTGEEVTR